jgi:hypothetical protein
VPHGPRCLSPHGGSTPHVAAHSCAALETTPALQCARFQPDGGGSPGNLVTSGGTSLPNAPGFSAAGMSCETAEGLKAGAPGKRWSGQGDACECIRAASLEAACDHLQPVMTCSSS